jgi:hypothetical protein
MTASDLIPWLAIATFALVAAWSAYSYFKAQKAEEKNVTSKLNDPSEPRSPDERTS